MYRTYTEEDRRTLDSRIAAKTMREEVTGCLLWTGGKKSGGFAKTNINSVTIPIHVYVCWKTHGEPSGPRLDALHSCESPHCLEPSHVFWGTRSQANKMSAARGKVRGKDRVPRRPKWEPLTVEFLLANSTLREDTGCREWNGTKATTRTKTRGSDEPAYGLVYVAPKTMRSVHRVMWELINGPVPDGLHVRHRCDNPPCCNPSHLLIGTPLDNYNDMAERGRAKRVRPSVENSGALVSEAQRKAGQRNLEGGRGNALRGEAWHKTHDGTMLSGDEWHRSHDGKLATKEKGNHWAANRLTEDPSPNP